MFTLLATGPWTRPQIQTTWSDTSSHTITPEIQTVIDHEWSLASARSNIHLFDGPMCRLESFSTTPRELLLNLSPTSYKQFLGTNLSNANIADHFGQQSLANPVGLSVALFTTDDQLLLGRRSHNVAYYPDRVHPFAGALEPRDKSSVFAGILRELHEELRLDENEIHDLVCLGLAQDNSLRQPELIFSARTSRTTAEIHQTLDTLEHRDLHAILADRASIASAVSDSSLTPVAAAALSLVLSAGIHG